MTLPEWSDKLHYTPRPITPQDFKNLGIDKYRRYNGLFFRICDLEKENIKQLWQILLETTYFSGN